MLVNEGLCPPLPGPWRYAVSRIRKDIIEVIVFHGLDDAEDIRGISGRNKAFNEWMPDCGRDPIPAKDINRWGLLNESLCHSVFILFHSHRHGLFVNISDNITSCRGDPHIKPLYDNRAFRLSFAASLSASATTAFRQFGDKLLSKKAGGICVAIDPDNELSGREINPCPPADHLVEGYRRLHIFEKDDIAHTGDVNAGGQKIHCRGYEVMPHRPPEIREIIAASGCCRTLEGIRFKPGP